MTRHTPGPWSIFAGERDGHVRIYAPNIAPHTGLIATLYKNRNANLIAAAPDLFAALVEARNVLQLTHKFDRLVAVCDAAIAKAQDQYD